MNFADPASNKYTTKNSNNKSTELLGAEKKLLLANLAHNSLSDLSNLINQVVKGSQSNQTLLASTHRSLAALDSTIEGTATNINKLGTIVDHLNSQEQIIEKSVRKAEIVKTQLQSINRTPLKQK